MSVDEGKIIRRISEIDAAMAELTAEKRALSNLLHMSAAEDRAGDVKSKRSYQRIYNEEKIKQVIRERRNKARSKDIFNALIRHRVMLKEPTLRSYLTRMAQRGDLERNKYSQTWSVRGG